MDTVLLGVWAVAVAVTVALWWKTRLLNEAGEFGAVTFAVATAGAGVFALVVFAFWLWRAL